MQEKNKTLESWKWYLCSAGVLLVIFIEIWGVLPAIPTLLHPLPSYPQESPVDPADNYAENLIKRPMLEDPPHRFIRDILLAPSGELLLLMRGRDRRFDTGIVIVLQNDIPQYTLEFYADRGYDLDFDAKGQLCLERSDDSFIGQYTVGGQYLGKKEKTERSYSYPEKITTPEGASYFLDKENQKVIKREADGTERTVYAQPRAVILENKIKWWMEITGLVLIVFGGVFSEIGCAVFRLVKDELAYSQEVKARIEEEKKSGKSIWR